MRHRILLLLLFPSLAFAYVPGKFYYEGKTHEKVIALTFDDGPGRTTPEILKLLADHHIRATFFMEGSQVERYPKIAKQVVEAGHEIGNHTYTHFNFHLAKNDFPERLAHELDQTDAAIKRATGAHPTVVRMPYGYFSKKLLPPLKARGYALVHWTYGSDWISKPKGGKARTGESIAQDYLAHAKPGTVYLFHDGGNHREKTLAAVTIVINTLEAKGYRFIAADEMFKDVK